ncbi:hypothetical protein RirG_130230 [Rhizophagus irregularis DAOM 197198w]|uniref:Uncharacterized protein n=1 Tax=Rhizophagus irregularis (strain DAOM 197198w) TaxID=1432141 RepID=A0A015KE83_RHIIW|nr:hypothetical protein RirG_130230 [Rhizophagus irregularis DAOM 197198w]
MASSHDFSTLSWDEVLSKLREVEDFCAKCALKQETLFARFNSLPDNSSAKFRKGFRYPPVDDHPSHDDPIIDNLPSLPLAIWASKHEADPNIILDLCTPSTRRTNRLCPSQRTPKFLCKRVSSMISPASFKCAQKIKTKLSFTRLVLSPSTIRLLVPPLSCPSEPKSPFQNTFPDSSLITPRISALEDIADYDHNVPSPVLSLNSTPAGFLLATSTSAPLLHDNVTPALLTQRVTSLARWSSSHRNNRRTCTFIQFQYHQSCFYLGLYFGCPFCKTPAAYVMSQFRHACHIHDRKLVHTPSPPPSPPFTLPCNRMSKRHADGFYKDVTSRRLGVSYHKSYAFHHVLEDDSGLLSA